MFFEEAQELLEQMESLLLAVNVDCPDKEECNAIFRASHSIKGGCAAFEMDDMVEVTHIMETLLDYIRKGESALTETHVNVFLQAKDVLRRQLKGHREKTPLPPEFAADILRDLHSLASKGDSDNKNKSTTMSNVDMPSPKPVQKLEDLTTVEPEVAEQRSNSHFFRVEMPKIAEDEFNALLSELGAKRHAESSELPNGNIVLQLETDINAEDLIAVCSFLVSPEDIKVTEETAKKFSIDLKEAEAPPMANAQPETENEDFGLFEEFAPPETEHQAREESTPIASAKATAATPPLVAAKTTTGRQDTVMPSGQHSMPENNRPGIERRQQDSPTAIGQDSTSIRVNLDKVDQLINLVGELVITQAMIDQHSDGLDPTVHEALVTSFTTLARNTRDLQEAIMSIRMMPMDFVFSRFPRMTRELAARLGKQVKLVTQGGATELDKGLIERIIDPLTHLVRNAVDHGLEVPSVRAAEGKSEAGTLLLSAAHEGGNIILEVSDDGAGLDRERILAKARENGLSVTDDMPDEEVWQIIFAPGFSTCAEVTDVSGRGVGMDVVKRNISAMGGSVEIHSTRGQGSTIRISLPLTLAILEGMSIKTGEEIYILPLAAVIESLKPNSESTRGVTGKGELIRVREEYLPLIPLHEVFGIRSRFTDPKDGIVVVLEAEGKKAALLVDSLVGQQQVVVKNIESNYRRVSGISGATILGDGNVSLILDIPSLLRMGSHY